ncbi:2Fe-2S iron-sulfur cluster-binding protein [Isorropodon fossajaponicum symbiont]|uniref:2Fe-2S iron-sulfur cluster-binding protein n=1 Tax=Isorropodon fossajaponicum symbiont TaxID=883811 RepID=UPI003CC9DB21
MIFTLHIWRQKNVNNQGGDCIVFDYDCREGICGACSLVINGYPHGEISHNDVPIIYICVSIKIKANCGLSLSVLIVFQ